MKTTMKKSIARVLTLALVLVMMMSFAVPAMASSTHNQSTLDAMQAVVQIDVYFVDPELGYEEWLTGGTGFFINEDTLLTCNHLVNQFPDEFYAAWAKETNKSLGVKRTAKDIKENLELRVAVLRDVSVKATVKKASTEMDFAILTLDEKIYDRTTLPLRKSSELLQTEVVYALGFPGIVANADDQPRNDAGDVTSSDGTVSKITRSTFTTTDGSLYKDVDVVEHGARISGGFSGGPLVDAEGNVVGINAVGNDVGSINMAVSMDPILQTLNALGIKYTAAEEVAPVETVPATEAPAPVETVAATEAPTQVTEETTQVTEEPTQVTEEEPGPGPGPGPGPVNSTILIVAAVAVLAVIIIIVVVMSKSKKKAPAASTGYTAPTAPSGGFTAPTYTAPMGAGETTVLASDAGETTILNHAANGGTLTRKRTNETITINAERFIIGRERKTANYCISDNSSISRSHVTLTVKNGTTYLTDMNAANGTFLNGVKVLPNQETALKSGDKIKLADEEFEFHA